MTPRRLAFSRLLQIASLTLPLAAGCYRPGTEPAAVVPNEAEAVGQPEADPSIFEAAEDPAAAVRRFADDLAKGKTSELLAALPERFRRDLDRWLDDRMRSLDPAVRRDAADEVARFAETLRKKRRLVLDSDRVEFSGRAAEFFREHVDPTCVVVATVARWPGWSAAEPSDFTSLLDVVVKAVAANPTLTQELRRIRVETVSADGVEAVVRISTDDEENGTDVSVVRIDDRWIPTALVERWEKIEDSDGAAKGNDGEREQRLRDLTARLADVTSALDGVSTQADFDALADRAATLLLATAAQADATPRVVTPDELVTVVVLGRLTDKEKDRLTWELAARSDAPASGLADSSDRPDGDGMIVTVGPVESVESFAKRLPGLKVERIDAKTRTITARKAEP